MSNSSDGRVIGNDRMNQALELAARNGGWITADLIGDYCWSMNVWRLKRGQALLRRLVREELFEVRAAPGRSVYLLTRHGAEHAEECGIPAAAGSKYGRVRSDGVWKPPLDFVHACRALRFLMAWSPVFVTEAEIRRHNPLLVKRPDGLVLLRLKNGVDAWGWVEVENTRKTGQAARELARALIAVSEGRALQIRINEFDDVIRPSHPILVLPQDARDERGFRLDHQQRIVRAVRRELVVGKVVLYFARDGEHKLERVVVDSAD